MESPKFPATTDEFQAARRTLARTPESEKRVRAHADITGTILNALQAAGYVRLVGANDFAIVGGSYVMTRPPAADDDSTKGAVIGQTWTDTSTGIVYTCVDATPSNAVWEQGAGGSGGASFGGRYDLTTVPQVIPFSTTGSPVEVTLSGWTEDRDDLHIYDGGAPTNFVAPAAGWYALTAMVNWGAIVGDSWLTLRLNSATDVVRDERVHSGEGSWVNVSTLKYLAADDVVQVVVQHFNDISGTPVDVSLASASFAMVLL